MAFSLTSHGLENLALINWFLNLVIRLKTDTNVPTLDMFLLVGRLGIVVEWNQ